MKSCKRRETNRKMMYLNHTDHAEALYLLYPLNALAHTCDQDGKDSTVCVYDITKMRGK